MGRDIPEDGERDPEGVRIVGRDEAEEALRSGAAVGRHIRSGPTAQPPAPSATHTQGIIRFPKETELDSVGEYRPTLTTKREELESVPALQERIIDIRDSADDHENETADSLSSSSFPQVDLPHWTERSSASSSEGVGSNFGGAKDDANSFTWASIGNDEVGNDNQAADDELEPVAPFAGDDASSEEAVDEPTETLASVKSETSDDAPKAEKSAEKTPKEPGKGATKIPGGLNSASLTTRVLTGLAAAVIAGLAFSAGPLATLVLALVVVLGAAIELFDGLRRVGYRPATLLGLIAIAGVVLGAYAKGVSALPLVTTLLVTFTLLWFLTGVSKAQPTSNTAVTVFAFLWVGVLGSYAALLLQMPDSTGLAFFIGAVAVTIAYDTGAYVGGSMIGRRPLAPTISPNKTWEGLASGTLAAVLVGGLLVQAISPWGVISGLLLGLVVSVVAPLGDLAESMVKRDLGIKDMGRLLPGHGGILDRFDALLFVLPATYYLVLLLGIS